MSRQDITGDGLGLLVAPGEPGGVDTVRERRRPCLQSYPSSGPLLKRSCPAGPAICYVVKRNSRGALPVDFRKARAKLAGEEYPSSIDTRVTDPFVCRSNSVAR